MFDQSSAGYCHIEHTHSVDGAWCLLAPNGAIKYVATSLAEIRARCEVENRTRCVDCPARHLCRP